ncbi:MAG: hypothetical protein OHK006_10940 [Thermodesulfovibrionales bacterium]
MAARISLPRVSLSRPSAGAAIIRRTPLPSFRIPWYNSGMMSGRVILHPAAAAFFLALGCGICCAAEPAAGLEEVRTGINALLLAIGIPVAIAIAVGAWLVYRNTIAKKFQTTIIEDFRREAEAYVKAGKYVSAAAIYNNKLKDPKTAAQLYEQGKDFRKAAEIYNFLGMAAKAKEMYVKDGNVGAAAEVSMMEGQFEDAARIYDQAGKKLDAAQAMERAGKNLAAARAYREAGEYRRAAYLLEKEGLQKEALEMYGLGLRGKKPDASTVGAFYDYAYKLEHAGEKEKAVAFYQEIDRFDPTYKDVRERIQTLSAAAEDPKAMEGKTSLRGFIKSGNLDHKSSLKLWLQILKALPAAYLKGRPYGLICPENILFDAGNAISFLKRTPASAYLPPEQSKGMELTESADIYSLGVLLYEMLTGSLDGLGQQRISDIDHELPEWLDDLVIKCIRKVREDRYQNIDEILIEIKTLSQSKKTSAT